ncbi:LysM peptidoglycan-binding domain-containing protein, partial [Synechococcus sp. FGCU-3]|nr:LysM peptidoglycan-binding domain-containing protein [Synechococcus sp. FGCU3]
MRRALAALALAVVLPLPGLADVVVKPGETLGEIAERYGVSVNRLMQANGIKDPTLVQIGQRLVIPGRATASRSGGGGGGDTRSGSYTVQSGDTIGEIAARYGVSETSLMQANGIKDPTLVQIGQRLVIPGRATASRSG